MEKNEANFEAYFAGNMSAEEIEKFNHELNTNPQFKEEYEFFLSIKKAAALIERDNLRQQLQKLTIADQTADAQNNKTAPSSKKWLPWVFSILLLIALSILVYKIKPSPQEPAQLFAQNFEPYEAQLARGNNTDELKQLFIKKEYKDFINRANNIEKTPEIHMMLANAYVETKAYDFAEKSFLLISDNSSLRDQKYWLLGLVQLKQNKIEQAKLTFQKLQALSNYKNKEIEKILSQL